MILLISGLLSSRWPVSLPENLPNSTWKSKWTCLLRTVCLIIVSLEVSPLGHRSRLPGFLGPKPTQSVQPTRIPSSLAVSVLLHDPPLVVFFETSLSTIGYSLSFPLVSVERSKYNQLPPTAWSAWKRGTPPKEAKKEVDVSWRQLEKNLRLLAKGMVLLADEIINLDRPLEVTDRAGQEKPYRLHGKFL